ESLRKTRTEHALRENTAQNSVAVLAAQAAAELEDEVGHPGCNLLHIRESSRRLDVDHRPDVEAADTRVTVEGGLAAVFGGEGLKPPNEVGQPFRRYSRILDETHWLCVAL